MINLFQFLWAAVLILNLFPANEARAQTLNLKVTSPNGEPVKSFRWLAEEDATYHVNPGKIDPRTLVVMFHFQPYACGGARNGR